VLQLLKELSEPKAEWGPALPKDRVGRYANSEDTQDMGTQSDFSTMWTQTRIILARTPMPSSLNLAAPSTPRMSLVARGSVDAGVGSLGGRACSIPIGADPEEVLAAIQSARLHRGPSGSVVEVMDAAAGTPDESFFVASLLGSVSSLNNPGGEMNTHSSATSAAVPIPGVAPTPRASLVLPDIPENKPLITPQSVPKCVP
jgi:hypothetical protein